MATFKRFVAKNGLDNNNQSIVNVADPQNDQDVATKKAVDTAVNTEVTARVNAVSTVQSSIDAEVTARSNADTTLQNNINAEVTSRTNAVSTVQANLDAEVTARSNAVNTLQNNINAEATARSNAVATLQAELSTVSSSVSALGNAFNYIGTVNGGATVETSFDLSTLASGQKDAGDYFKVAQAGYFKVGSGGTPFYANQNDGLVWNTSEGVDKIDNTNSSVSGTSNFIAVSGTADTGFVVDVDNVFKTRVTNAEADILSEKTARTNADTTLQNNINTQATARANADTTLQNNINTVTNNLNTEITARTNADTTLTSNLNAEVTARGNADTTLQNNINAEVTARSNADTSLQNNINAEITARTNADTTLQNNINAKQDATTAITTSNIGSQAVASAGKLTTARTVALSGDVTGSVSFDGSADVTITTSVAANSVALGTDTTGNYVASITNGSYITGGAAGSEGATLTLAVDADSANTASKVVARDANGDFAGRIITATDFNATSDLRLKSNVETMVNTSAVLMQLRPVSYIMNATGKKSYGVIAQEIKQVLPELVNEDPDGMMSVSYTPLIAFLIETVQSQQNVINEMKARLDDLESK